jgi:hypothetical protein
MPKLKNPIHPGLKISPGAVYGADLYRSPARRLYGGSPCNCGKYASPKVILSFLQLLKTGFQGSSRVSRLSQGYA